MAKTFTKHKTTTKNKHKQPLFEDLFYWHTRFRMRFHSHKHHICMLTRTIWMFVLGLVWVWQSGKCVWPSHQLPSFKMTVVSMAGFTCFAKSLKREIYRLTPLNISMRKGIIFCIYYNLICRVLWKGLGTVLTPRTTANNVRPWISAKKTPIAALTVLCSVGWCLEGVWGYVAMDMLAWQPMKWTSYLAWLPGDIGELGSKMHTGVVI